MRVEPHAIQRDDEGAFFVSGKMLLEALDHGGRDRDALRAAPRVRDGLAGAWTDRSVSQRSRDVGRERRGRAATRSMRGTGATAPAMRELLDEHGRVPVGDRGLDGAEGGESIVATTHRAYFADARRLVRGLGQEDERCFDLAAAVLLLYRRGQGKGSGVEVDRSWASSSPSATGRMSHGQSYLIPRTRSRPGSSTPSASSARRTSTARSRAWHPDVEWEHQTGTGAPEEGLYRGRDQVRSLLGRLREAWDDFHVDVRDVARCRREQVRRQRNHPRAREDQRHRTRGRVRVRDRVPRLEGRANPFPDPTLRFAITGDDRCA